MKNRSILTVNNDIIRAWEPCDDDLEQFGLPESKHFSLAEIFDNAVTPIHGKLWIALHPPFCSADDARSWLAALAGNALLDTGLYDEYTDWRTIISRVLRHQITPERARQAVVALHGEIGDSAIGYISTVPPRRPDPSSAKLLARAAAECVLRDDVAKWSFVTAGYAITGCAMLVGGERALVIGWNKALADLRKWLA
jgi:hypothetical protein